MKGEGAKVVITGCGVVSSIGIGRESFAAALAEGCSGIGEIVSFDAAELGREKAAEISGFDETPFLRSPKNYLDRNSALAFAAAEMALRESELVLPDMERGYGLSVGTFGGNLESLAAFYAKLVEKGPRLAPPFLFPHTYYNTTAGLLSIEYGLNGPHAQFCSGSAAGMEAILYAAHCLKEGRAPAILAGGVESLNEWLFRAAILRRWVSPIDEGRESCRPFSQEGNGAVLGEGAAFFTLELQDSAVMRGTRILCEILSCAVASSASAAMRKALDHVRARDVDALFSSAAGYPVEDEEEAVAVRDVFGEKKVPVVAIKSLVGETLGAGGAINLAAATASLEGGILPGTAVDGEPDFPWLDLVRQTRRGALQKVMVNAGSPGKGHWISLIISTAVSR